MCRGRLSEQLALLQSFAQNAFVDAPARATTGQLAVDENRRHTAHTVLSGTVSKFLLLHFMHHHFVL
jgi:hypothetical protein